MSGNSPAQSSSKFGIRVKAAVCERTPCDVSKSEKSWQVETREAEHSNGHGTEAGIEKRNGIAKRDPQMRHRAEGS